MDPDHRKFEARQPVRRIPTDPEPAEIQRRLIEGIGLCLSGGGYRAMLFHVGSLWRLNEAGMLVQFDHISSVSGGSITSAVLGFGWQRLDFDEKGIARRFLDVVVEPLRRLASHTIDVPAVLWGIVLPWTTIAQRVAGAYTKHLFGPATLQDLPTEPRFVINATNVQSGVLWRFSRPYMADYRVGMIESPRVRLADVVAASSAFPPFLSPLVLRFKESDYRPIEGTDLHRPPFTTRVVLTDGGVYDNLGLETVYKKYRTVLVSDGGAEISAQPRPWRNWASHSLRVIEIVQDQVGNLRKRQLIQAYVRGDRQGAYWGIQSNIADFHLADAIPCDFQRTQDLANVPTRLARLPDVLQERLINWGYAVCDAAIRRHVRSDLSPVEAFPYPSSGV